MLLQARRLNVQNDMQPVCSFFKSQGLSEQEVVEVGLDTFVLSHHSMPKLAQDDSYGITPSDF